MAFFCQASPQRKSPLGKGEAFHRIDADWADPEIQLNSLYSFKESVCTLGRESRKLFPFLACSTLASSTVRAIIYKSADPNLMHADVLLKSALGS